MTTVQNPRHIVVLGAGFAGLSTIRELRRRDPAAQITLVAPPHFLPETKLHATHDLREVIGSVDAIMSLRTQTERHSHQTYGSLKDYASDFCITQELIGERDIILLHPGPVHRNIDIDDAMLKDPRCKVLEQVKNGVAIRMAVLKALIA